MRFLPMSLHSAAAALHDCCCWIMLSHPCWCQFIRYVLVVVYRTWYQTSRNKQTVGFLSTFLRNAPGRLSHLTGKWRQIVGLVVFFGIVDHSSSLGIGRPQITMAPCRPPSRTQLEPQARSHERVLQCVPMVVRAGHASRAELRCWQAGLCAKTPRGCLEAETCHKIFMHDDSAANSL